MNWTASGARCRGARAHLSLARMVNCFGVGILKVGRRLAGGTVWKDRTSRKVRVSILLRRG